MTWKTFWSSITWTICENYDNPFMEGLCPVKHRGIVVTSFLRQPPVTWTSFLSGVGGKGKTKPRGRSVNQKKLVIRCFHCNFSGHLSGQPYFVSSRTRTNMMIRHTLRVARWERRFMCTPNRLSLVRYRLRKSQGGPIMRYLLQSYC